MLNRLGVDHEFDRQSDGRTGGQTKAMIYCADKPFRSNRERKLTLRRAKCPMRLLCDSGQIQLVTRLVHKDDFMAFREPLSSSAVILGPKIVEHKICLLTWALSHIGQVNTKQHWNGECIAQEPLDNALVLGNFCEYRHKSYTAKN